MTFCFFFNPFQQFLAPGGYPGPWFYAVVPRVSSGVHDVASITMTIGFKLNNAGNIGLALGLLSGLLAGLTGWTPLSNLQAALALPLSLVLSSGLRYGHPFYVVNVFFGACAFGLLVGGLWMGN